MNRLLLALLVCAACKHSTSTSSTSHTETQTVTDTKTSESGATTTVTTQTEGPSKTVTVVEEYGPPSTQEEGPAKVPEADGGIVQYAPEEKPHVDRPRRGPLTRRTVTTTEHGPDTSQTRQEATSQATGATETKAAGKSDVTAKAQEASAPSASCVGASWIWGLAVLVGVGGIVWFAVKMRKAV